jgi:uncharacterized protein YdeI (YjbR/CyaY-like superfamily)
MAPPAARVVEAAKASGTWTGLDDVEDLVEPAELTAALDAVPRPGPTGTPFPRSTRRATLEWIAAAKRPATRERRIAETVELAARNLRAQQWPARPDRFPPRGFHHEPVSCDTLSGR